MSESVRYERAGPVAIITMDDGKVNSLSLSTLAALNEAFDQAEQDKAAVVLTGRAGVFSGGFDLGTFKEGGEALHQMLKGGAELASRVMAFPMPVVSACSGHCIAMGVFLEMSADMRLGAAGPFKYVANEVAIGLTMPRFAIEIARPRLTPSHFNLALVLANVYSPDTAVEAGFLDRVVPADQLLEQATQTATQLCKLNLGAHAASKLLVRERALQALRDAIDVELGTYEAFTETMERGMRAAG